MIYPKKILYNFPAKRKCSKSCKAEFYFMIKNTLKICNLQSPAATLKHRISSH